MTNIQWSRKQTTSFDNKIYHIPRINVGRITFYQSTLVAVIGNKTNVSET